jgi:WD40 repeat protein
MTPSGNAIVMGTENGTIAYYDVNGNLTWTYYSVSRSGGGNSIQAVALTQDGSKVIAGSFDGKVILLDSAGNPLWTYITKNDRIVRAAIASDGSLAVAAGDNTIYAFTEEPKDNQGESSQIPMKTPLPTISSDLSSELSPETISTSTMIPVIPRTVDAETPAVTLTEYSVIRKSTQSPLDETAGIVGTLIVFFVIFRKGR